MNVTTNQEDMKTTKQVTFFPDFYYILAMDSGFISEEVIVDLADFFKVFGDATRLKILFFLEEEDEVSVSSIAERLNMSQSAISQQLKVLRQSRLVKFRKDGKNVYYRLCDDHINKILTLGSEHYKELL